MSLVVESLFSNDSEIYLQLLKNNRTLIILWTPFFSFLVQLTSKKANFICSAVFCLACNPCCCKGKQLLQLFVAVPAVCDVAGVDLVALWPTGPVHYTGTESWLGAVWKGARQQCVRFAWFVFLFLSSNILKPYFQLDTIVAINVSWQEKCLPSSAQPLLGKMSFPTRESWKRLFWKTSPTWTAQMSTSSGNLPLFAEWGLSTFYERC